MAEYNHFTHVCHFHYHVFISFVTTFIIQTITCHYCQSNARQERVFFYPMPFPTTYISISKTIHRANEHGEFKYLVRQVIDARMVYFIFPSYRHISPSAETSIQLQHHRQLCARYICPTIHDDDDHPGTDPCLS